jgi:hypothetical protein
MSVPAFLTMVQLLQLHAQKLMVEGTKTAQQAQTQIKAAIEAAQKQ